MRHCLLALLVLTACSRAPRAPVPEPPAAVRLSQGSARYAVIEHRHVRQIYQDRPIVTDATTSLLLSLTLTAADSGLVAEVVLDSIAGAGDAAGTPVTRAAGGTRLLGRIELTNPVLAFPSPESPDPLLDQIMLGLHDLLPSLPPGGVTPGDTWADSTIFRGRTAGLPITLTTHTAYRAGPWSDFGGERVLEVLGDARYVLAGEGDQLGQWITMHGTGTVSTRRLLTPRGTIVLGIRVDSLQVDVEVQATGVVIPVAQTRVDTVRQVLP